MDKDKEVKKTYVTQLFEECRGMAVYAAERGMNIDISVAECINQFEHWSTQPNEIKMPSLAALVNAHNTLSRTIAPAKPQTVLLVKKGSGKGILGFRGPVPLVRHMIMVTIASLVIFIGVVLTSFVDQNDINIFSSKGLPLLVQLFFLIAASALGASFGALYKVNQYIENLTYDPKRATSYWIRFYLGIISGLILSLVIEKNAIDSTLFETNIVRPLLAIVGGFSAELFYTLLNRMVETIKALFESSGKEILDNRIKAVNLKATQKEMTSKIALIQQLIALQKNIMLNPDSKEIKKAFEKMWEKLFPEIDPPDDPTTEPTADTTSTVTGDNDNAD